MGNSAIFLLFKFILLNLNIFIFKTTLKTLKTLVHRQKVKILKIKFKIKTPWWCSRFLNPDHIRAVAQPKTLDHLAMRVYGNSINLATVMPVTQFYRPIVLYGTMYCMYPWIHTSHSFSIIFDIISHLFVTTFFVTLLLCNRIIFCGPKSSLLCYLWLNKPLVLRKPPEQLPLLTTNLHRGPGYEPELSPNREPRPAAHQSLDSVEFYCSSNTVIRMYNLLSIKITIIFLKVSKSY